GRSDGYGDGAETEGHDGAIGFGKGREGTVRFGA
ncbi:hypothetical protein A2U01_0069676, partial [Trifolium medium]|nr:hypothetical protein [Trifolium medium]